MMENFEFEYYLIRNTFKNGTVPLLRGDDDVSASETNFLSYNKKVVSNYKTHLCLNSPIPAKPDLNVDGLNLDGDCCVFSKKIYDAVNPHQFRGLQFVPAVIRGKNNEEITDFYVANIYQKRISSFNKDNTIYKRIDEMTGSWDGIKKIVLDKEQLSKIPLDDRLVYVAEEHCGFILYHKTIVDVMKSVNPDNIIFIPVEVWYDGVQFKQ